MLTQLCNSTSLRIDSGEPPLRDSGRTDDDGTVEISISDDAHQVLAELLVTDAEPDETFELTVIESGPGGPGLGTAGGFAEGVAVARTVSVSTTALPGSYRATLRMALTAQELIDLGVTAKDLELHALDSSQGTWYAAGHNLGQMEPDGTVGQSGFTLYDDGSVDYWATLDEMGEYTVGQAPGEPEPQQDAIPKSGGSRPTGGLCGVAAIYWLTVACLGLFMGRACRQAKRLVTW
jgi:hypothetical protein